MFKSFALIALAGVASASYGYGQQYGYGYGVQQYSAPSYDSYDYQPKRGDGFDDGYSKGFAGYGKGSRRHQTLDLDDEKEPKIYGRKDARREVEGLVSTATLSVTSETLGVTIIETITSFRLVIVGIVGRSRVLLDSVSVTVLLTVAVRGGGNTGESNKSE